ncbi:hypothetical protein FISHEDRAFT_53045, partial [Fistulina hepatica ATCC 64428]
HPLTVFGLPKKQMIEYRLLSKPCSVVRDVTRHMVHRLDQLKNATAADGAASAGSNMLRLVLTGEAGSGKSVLLIQTIEHCATNGWITLYFPRATTMVNSSTVHAYDVRTQTYHQPMYAYRTLQRILASNKAILSRIPLQHTFSIPRNSIPLVDKPRPLYPLPLAPVVLEHFMNELSIQTHAPVFMGVDELQALYQPSKYRDPHFVPIQPYHLSLPRMILEFASGRRKFARGAFVGAVCDSDTHFPVPRELQAALNLTVSVPLSPYDKMSSAILSYTKGLKSVPLPSKMSIKEAASLYEVWSTVRGGTQIADDEYFLSKYSEASGNPGLFIWGGLLNSLQSSIAVNSQ